MEKKHLVSLGIIACCLLILGIASSFAYFVATINKNNVNQTNIDAGMIGSIKYDGETTFNETSIYPGMKAVQTFTIEKGSQDGIGIYEIDLEAIVPEVFGSDIEISLYKTTDPTTNNITREEGSITQTSEGFYKEDKITINGSLELVYGPKNLTNNNQITLEQYKFNTETLEKTIYYLVYNYKNNGNQNSQQGQTFSGKVTVRLISDMVYTENILNGADPVIKDELIPVTIDNDGTVKKADLESKWYSYYEKRWANAIILKDESTASNYKAGSVIPEDEIESYFVWIPKYRYQLWDLGQYEGLTSIDESKVHEIPIIFGNYNTSDSVDGECTTPMESGETGNCKVGDYMTHPAFLSIPSTGFWVGKFETGYDGANSVSEVNQNIRDESRVIIKPNVIAWQGIQPANAFYTSYDYKRNLDSHMMKNTEWGAVAYLQHSKYGSATSVRINNNSDYITGYAANNEPTCGYTGTNEECNSYCNDGSCNKAYPNSVLASTTNNITGIYDMSGGSHEYVMGVMLDQSGKPMSGRNSLYNSGFNGTLGSPTYDNDASGLTEIINGYNWPDKKYYDAYAYSSNFEQFQNRILGDATGEVGPFNMVKYFTQTARIGSWYTDGAAFVGNVSPWVVRGYNFYYGLNAGIFTFIVNTGGVAGSFRLVLTP